jgi:hypothetical protein
MEDGWHAPEAAMSRKFVALNSITFLVTLSGAGADPTPLWINQGEELHSAVTDVTEVVDMSYADPMAQFTARRSAR